MADMKKVGKKSRRKGRKFEQRIARALRARWPEATVRRALQSHKPYEPDLVIEGPAPLIVRSLWLELTDGKDADLRVPGKLEQAERDIDRAHPAGEWKRYPVCIWHIIAQRRIHASMRIQTLGAIMGEVVTEAAELLGDAVWADTVIEMSFEDFLNLLPPPWGDPGTPVSPGEPQGG